MEGVVARQYGGGVQSDDELNINNRLYLATLRLINRQNIKSDDKIYK